MAKDVTKRIDDGHSTTISFGTSDVELVYEKTVTPPGMTGGGPIDVTTMLNSAYRTNRPKQLKSVGPTSFTAAYEVGYYDEIIAAINVNQLMTIVFPDSSTLAFYGWLDEVTPAEMTEGSQPTATFTIQPSNLHSTTLAETAPVYTAGT